MPVTARRILPFVLALGLAACAGPPTRGPVDAWATRAAPPAPALSAPPPARARAAHASKSAVLVRPRMLGRALTFETLSPAVAVQPFEAALYEGEQTPALRSAGLRQLSAQHLGEGRAEAAVGAARAGHDLALEAYGPDHVETITALIGLSDALTAAGRTTEGEAALLVASSQALRLFGPAHPAAQAAARRLALHRGLTPLRPLLRSFNRRTNRLG